MTVNMKQTHGWKASSFLVLLVSLTFLLGAYELLRYAGWWGEPDTAAFTRFTADMQANGSLISANGEIYYNGYGYPALMVWLVTMTGLSVGTLQILGGALLATWVVVPAWLAYHEFTHSQLAATLATLIILIQPEFLFPLLRGSHEKFTRGLMFLALYLLLRSMRDKSSRITGALVVSFYLCAYALISFNNFMAFSFILAIAMALGLMWIYKKWPTKGEKTETPVLSKLILVVLSMLVVAFMFTFYAYPPARYQLYILKYFIDRLAVLTMNAEAPSNPYVVITNGWISRPVYYLVSVANWLLLGTSLLIWLKQGYDWLVKRKDQAADHESLLWALFASMAFLGVCGIALDVSGALGSNMQLRLYPTFAMIAAPLLGTWIAKQKLEGKIVHKTAWVGTSLVIGCVMILSMIKASNEPLFSNYWLYYSSEEQQAVSWAEEKLNKRSVWTGLTGRVLFGYIILNDGKLPSLILTAGYTNEATKNLLISDVERLYAQRIADQIPIKIDSFITYDNGKAQIYHRRPITPYQK